MTRQFKSVLFDWDGTLVDTAEASFRCFVQMFSAFDIPFDRDTYARTYSPNWHHTFRCLGLPEERWAEADERWLTHFAEEPVELLPGTRDALETLAAAGIVSGIVTSGTRSRVLRELAAHGLGHHFRETVFGSDVTEKKPHPAALQLCLERLGVAPDEAAYVGDSPEDVQMARAAGVFAVAVPGGYPNRDALAASGADLMANDVSDAVKRLISVTVP
jgi:phosphoglycolate phosphatase